MGNWKDHIFNNPIAKFYWSVEKLFTHFFYTFKILTMIYSFECYIDRARARARARKCKKIQINSFIFILIPTFQKNKFVCHELLSERVPITNIKKIEAIYQCSNITLYQMDFTIINLKNLEKKLPFLIVWFPSKVLHDFRKKL